MALAWVEAAEQNGQHVLEVRTGAGSPYYEIFLATRPELIRSNQALARTSSNFYSSRQDHGLLTAPGGRALFPLPQKLLERFHNGRVHYVVKTYRDAAGNGPSLSPVMSLPPDQPTLLGYDPTEEPMQYSSIDREEPSAALGEGNGLFAPRAQGRSRVASSRLSSGPRRRSASKAARRKTQPELAGALALVCERLQRMTALDPAIPGRPSASDHARVLSHLLANIPSPRGQSSAAGLLHAQIRGLSRPQGGARELAREVVAARRRLTRGRQLSQEAALPAVMAALGPALAQILPTLLPTLLPMLQNLLAQMTPAAGSPAPRASSLSSSRDPLMASVGLDYRGRQSREQFFAALLPLITSVLPTVLPMLAQLLPSLLGGLSRGRSVGLTTGGAVLPAPTGGLPTTVTGTAGAVSGPPTGSIPPADAAALAGQIQAALAGAPAGGGGAVAGAAPAPQLDPVAIGQLMQAVGGAGGGGSAIGMPGSDLLKSVVDRLPIEKMFDGQAWIPQIKHDEWIQTLPWERVLSLSSSAAALGALFLPGRGQLDRLEGVELSLRNVTTIRLEGNQESWVFVNDQPARLELEVRAGRQALERPFVDVRVSEDGTPSRGIQRSVFRVDSVPAGQATTLSIEVPPAVLQRVPRGGEAICVSIRLIEQTGDDRFRGTELRASFHVVSRHSLVLAPDAGLDAASELDGLPGLSETLPTAGAAGDARQVEWSIDAAADGVDALARYVPVRQRRVGENVVLSGGLQISPLGLADLARRLAGNSLDAERLASLKSALEGDRALRQRLSLVAHESLSSSPRTGANQEVAVLAHFVAASAYLVSFGGIGPHGNPTSREVTRVRLPVPRGISLRQA